MEKAIKKAIEGGYKLKGENDIKYLFYPDVWMPCILDPLFWQCLGKAEGWKKFRCTCGECFDMTGFIQCTYCNKVGAHYAWHANWINFINHLAEGKEIDEFFNNLLK